MKIKQLPYLAGSLLLTLTMAITSCSSSQQQQQQEAVAGQQQGQQEENYANQQQGNEYVNQQNENYANNENNNYDDNNYDNQENMDNQQFAENQEMMNNQEGGGNEFAEAEEEGDLEDIVEEMNQTAGMNEAPIEADPAPQGVDNPAAGDMVADSGMNEGMADAGMADAGMTQDANAGMASNNLSAGNSAGAPMQQDMAAAPQSSAAMATQAGTDGLPEMGAKMSYIVQKGDTLGKIAQKIYGDMSRWRELAAFTGVNNPSLIYPGDLIYYQLDETSVAFARSYENLQRSEVVVASGDTLAKIATRVLGDAQNWRAIWRQNDNINDPDKLVAGDVLFYVSAEALATLNTGVDAIADSFAAYKSNPVQDTVEVKKDSSVPLTLTLDDLSQTTLKPEPAQTDIAPLMI